MRRASDPVWVRLGPRDVPAPDVATAARVAVACRDANALGASDWYAGGYGLVTRGGRVLARVHYNGRVERA